jgi:hypothetical protein
VALCGEIKAASRGGRRPLRALRNSYRWAGRRAYDARHIDIIDSISVEIVDRTSAIKGLEEAREVVMLAQMITAMASAAATSPAPAQATAAEVTLGYVSVMLGEVAETIDVASLHLKKALQSIPGASPPCAGKH